MVDTRHRANSLLFTGQNDAAITADHQNVSITTDGTSVWAADYVAGIAKIDIATWQCSYMTLSSVEWPSSGDRYRFNGITYSGGFLYATDLLSGYIYKVDPVTGATSEACETQLVFRESANDQSVNFITSDAALSTS